MPISSEMLLEQLMVMIQNELIHPNSRGHQNAVLAGLMEAMERCDITISI